jgi:CO/xanthine dehydrogenase FAD-binding subunit
LTLPAPVLLRDALQLLSQPGMSVLAGGTDFFPALQGLPAPVDVLDVTRILELKPIRKEPGGWRIGAAATWTDLLNAELPAVFDGLKIAGRQVGSVQIQNTATVVGNICNASPAADGLPPLLAMNALAELSALDTVRKVPLQGFILGVRQTDIRPGELVTGLLIPDHPADAISDFHKLGARAYLVISIAMIAATIVPDPQGRIADVRIAVGSCSPVARRLSALESALSGLSLADDDLSAIVQLEHLSVLSPLDDVRGSAAYRLTAVQEMLRRLLVSCARKALAAQASQPASTAYPSGGG